MDSENIRGIAGMGMQALSLYYDTDESKEGGLAFKEKRKPNFSKFKRKSNICFRKSFIRAMIFLSLTVLL